jgi:putative membrane protein insertion efficiency factor/ribonuclease P protein component
MTMLPARYRMTSSTEISRAIRHGQRARRGGVVVHVHLSSQPEVPSRAAFAVNKAVGDSVTRHRVTRRLRAVTLPLLDRLPPGTDLVVRALPESANATSAELERDVERALTRVTVLTPLHSASPPSREDEALTAPEQGTTQHLGVMWWIGWPIRSLLLALIWVYRHTISPMLPPTCRYHPSCSAYGFKALQVHGAAKGTILAAWRVLRCNPFTPGGLDPVPAKGAWRPDIHPDGTPRVAGHSHP